jgi:glycosyltransferase involved in cell wall biosynthesis
LSLLAGEFPDIHLTMIGPDKGDGSAQAAWRTARELKIEDRVNFKGAVPKPEVPEWLNRGDIFLNTTNVDNMPVSMLEAMACGLCVVSTNVGGIPYLVNHQQDALLVPPDDAEPMASAVKRILTEPELAVSLSKHGRLKTEQLDWAVVIKRWERVLSDVLASPTDKSAQSAATPWRRLRTAIVAFPLRRSPIGGLHGRSGVRAYPALPLSKETMICFSTFDI